MQNNKNKNVLDFLMENKADVNAEDSYGMTPLHYASLLGNVECVELILKKDKKLLNVKDKQKMTPLHVAAVYGQVDVAKKLIQEGADLTCETEEEGIPLQLAAAEGKLEVVKQILEKCSKSGDIRKMLKHEDINKNTSLYLAVGKGHTDVVKHLITVCKENNYKDAINAHKQGHRRTPLHLAAKHGRLEIVELLINNGAEIDSKDENLSTPLILASKYNRHEVVKLLANKEAKIEHRNSDHFSALLIAANYGHKKTIDVLLKKGANVMAADKNDKSVLFLCAEAGQVKALQMLLADGKVRPKLLNFRDRYGNTPLHVAAQMGHYKVVKMLLDKKVQISPKNEDEQISPKNEDEQICPKIEDEQISPKNEDEQTPLHLAAENGRVKIVQELVGRKHEIVHSLDENANSPLHLAALSGKISVVRELVRLGASVRARNAKYWTPLDCCASTGMHKSAQVLLEANCLVDPEDKKKVTPLHLACKHGYKRMVQLLLKWRADITKKDAEGRNALDFAIDFGHASCARVILEDEKWREAMKNRTAVQKDDEKTEEKWIKDKRTEDKKTEDNKAEDKKMEGEKAEDKKVEDKKVEDKKMEGEKAEDKKVEDKKMEGEKAEDKKVEGEKMEDEKIDTPMRKLIRKMPDVAEEVFRKCMRGNGKNADPKKTVTYDYQFLEDEFLCGSWCDITNEPSQSQDSEQNIPADAEPYTKDFSILKKNHPLNIMICSNRENLLLHPLVCSFLDLKWTTYARTFYMLNLLTYVIFLAVFNSYMLTTPPIYSVDTLNVTTSCVAIISQAQPNYGECYDYNAWGSIARIILLTLAGISLMKEGWQLYNRRDSYFLSLTNIVELSFYTTAILTVYSDYPSSTGPNFQGIREPWQWQVGAISIFLSWMGLIMFIQNLPVVGMFVLMFKDVYNTFMKFFIVFVLFILGFSFSFHCLLQNKYASQQLLNSVIKTFIMMIGEFDLDAIPSPEITLSIKSYSAVAYILFIFFLIVMSIIIMNLLTGLAVYDITEMRENAELKRLTKQTKLILDIDSLLPLCIKRKLFKTGYTYNQENNQNILWPWFYSDSKSDKNSQKIKKTSSMEKGFELQKKFEKIETKFDQLEERARLLRRQLDVRSRSMECMIKAIMEKLVVMYDEKDEDFDSNL